MDDNKKTFKVLPDIEANLEFTADDGVIIKYMDLGEDKTNPDQHTVVLVHGLTANSKMWGDAVVSTGYSGANVVGILVENGFRVLISDLRVDYLENQEKRKIME